MKKDEKKAWGYLAATVAAYAVYLAVWGTSGNLFFYMTSSVLILILVSAVLIIQSRREI